MTDLSPRLQALFEKTKKVCFGRFIIQVPVTATVVYGPTEVETRIFFYEGQGNKVAEYLSKRLAEIEDEREYLMKDDIPKLPLFGKVIDGIQPGQKILFGSKDQVSYTIHSFIPLGKDLFVQQRYILPEYDGITTLNLVASHLRLRMENEIPAEPGSCIEGGFVNLEQKYERATIGIRLKEFPDVHFSVDAHKNQEYLPEGSNPTLLREQAKQFAEADGLGAIFARTKILRQQARTLNIWNGEEMALRTPAYKDDKSIHEFRFHSLGSIKNSLHPELDVRFETGLKGNSKAAVNPSLTDEEALIMWDKIITTIRLRQPSDATLPATAQNQFPLASRVRTGDVCPQSGWWECAENEKNEINKRHLFKAGDPMPHLLLVKKPNIWQKLIGNYPMRQIPTEWKLVEYANEPAAPFTTG